MAFEKQVSAQDPQFTQFYSVPLYLAPSFAGATLQHRLSTTMRKQWVALPGDFGTYTLAYDHYFPKFNSGVGFMVMQDQAGSGKMGFSYFNALYSYDITLIDNWHVRPGLGFIYSVYKIDFSKLVFSDQIRNGETKNLGPSYDSPPVNQNRSYIDGTASILFYNQKIWCGVTLDHLLQPNISFYYEKSNTALRFNSFGGIKLYSHSTLLKASDESVSIAYQYRMMSDYKQLDIGLYWYSVPWVMGLWYRGIPPFNSQRGDAIAVLGGIKFRSFSVGYSYDFTISNLISSTAGAHELSLIYEFQTERKKKYHSIPCPEF